MKYINLFSLIILITLSLTDLYADHSIQFDLDNDPRFHMELTLPDDLLATVSDKHPNTILLANQKGTLVEGNITFIKNEPNRIHLEKWSAFVEDVESDYPEKCLVNSPLIALPTLPGAFATYSIIVQTFQYIPFTMGINVIVTEDYACLINLPLKENLDKMVALCQSIANGLHLTVTDK